MKNVAGEISLQLATDSDREFVARVFTVNRSEGIAAAALSDRQRQQLMDIQFEAQQTQYRARFPQSELSLILSANEPIGYIHLDRSGDHYVLIDIAILPEHTGQAVGSRLVEGFIAEAFAQGKVVRAHVEKLNQGAWRLWQSLGFRAVADDGVYLEIECSAALER